MIRTLLLAIIVGILGLATYLYFYLGAYKGVAIGFEERGPLYLVYKNHTGPYHEMGPVIQSVENWATSNNVICAPSFGEYLDNPDTTDQDRLHSRGGCLANSPVTVVDKAFTFEERPKQKYLVAHFTGSPAISPYKVYPKIQAYLAQHRLRAKTGSIEIYTINGDKVSTDYLITVLNP